MKKVFSTIIAIAVSASAAFAQEQAVPDFKNTPMLIKADGSLGKLEKPTVETKTKTKGYSYGASQVTFLNILGGYSPIKIDASAAKFIVKMQDEETDPEGAIYITKVIIAGKDTREVELAQSAAAIAAGFGGKGKSVQKDDIKVDFAKVAPGVYSFTPQTPLQDGTEYAVMLDRRSSNQGIQPFCFGTNGVAPKKKK